MRKAGLARQLSIEKHLHLSARCHGFEEYFTASTALDLAQHAPEHLLQHCYVKLANGFDLLVLERCMGDLDVATAIVQAAENQYVATRRTLFQGIQYCLRFDALSVAKMLARVVTSTVWSSYVACARTIG